MKRALLLLFGLSIFCFGKVVAQNYVLYGTTLNGGSSTYGTIFEYNINTGYQNVLLNYTGSLNGAHPYGDIIPDSGRGLFYGMTNSGGKYNEGVLFDFNNCNGETGVINFKSNVTPYFPYGNLVYDTLRHIFYGMTSSGGNGNMGVIFSFNPITNIFMDVFDFNGFNGSTPLGTLALDPVNGLYYGMTYSGGVGNGGTIFTFDPNTNAESVVLNFSSTCCGGGPYGSLTWDPADSMFGGMNSPKTANGGNLFYFNPKTNTYNIYTSFRCIWGESPYGSLTYDPVNKRLYGMTTDGPCSNHGNIFWYIPTPANWGSVFNLNGTTQGSQPYGSLTWDPSTGLFYSVTRAGGTNDSGVMFSINPITNAQTVLVNFNKANGAMPLGELMYDPATKMLYGMTFYGGTNNKGVLYKYNPYTNTETVLLNFNGTNGANPYADLTYLPTNGMLYGMTLNGGTYNKGTLFQFDTTTNTETVLTNLGQIDSNEYAPFGNLSYDPFNGNYYGLASKGGINSHGALFSFNPSSGKDSVLLPFDSAIYPMGASPYGSLVFDSINSLFYGMTGLGGNAGQGVLFSFDPVTYKDSTLTNFNGANGSLPQYNNLIHDPANGLFYGMTQKGGTYSDGVIFSLDPTTKTQNVLFSFNGANGQYPYGSLTYNPSDGLLYGMTYSGGSGNYGTLFSFNPSTNIETVLLNFNKINGANPEGSLIYDSFNGMLYGLTAKGGSLNYGVIFSFNTVSNNDSVLLNFNVTNGEYPIGDLTLINSSALKVSFSGKPSIVCPINFTTIDVSGGTSATYLWSTGATTSSINVSPTATKTYSVFVCDGIYSRDTTITVTVYPILTISQLKNVSCCGDSDGSATIVIDSAVAPFTYSWSTNPVQTNSQATGLKAGTYTITIHDSNGCVATTSVTITQPACLQDSINSTCATCCNCIGTTHMYVWGGTKPYTYLWSNGDTTDALTGLSSATYTCAVTDANGCAITDTIFVHKGTHVNTTQVNVGCNGGSNGSASISLSGNYSYSWSPGGGTGSTASALSAGSYTVTVTNNDTGGCVASYVINVGQPTPLNASAIAISGTSCNGSSNGSASASGSGGTPGYSFKWSDGETTPTATGLPAGNSSVTITDANGCKATASVFISQPSPLSITVNISGYDPYNICSDTGCYWVNTWIAGGTPPYYGGYFNSPICTTTSSSVYVTDANGCFASANFNIWIGLEYNVQINNNVTCYGGNNGKATVSILDGSGNYGYSWAPCGGTNYIASGLSAGVYTVTVTDKYYYCTIKKSITITQPPAIIVTTIVTPGSCNINGIALASVTNGVSPYTYLWSGGHGTNATATGLSSGIYTLTLTDHKGCTASATAIITQPPALTVSTNSSSKINCHGDSNGSGVANVSGGTLPYTYLWSNSQTVPTISGLSAGTYSITVSDSCGNSATSTVIISEPPILSVSLNPSDVLCNGGNSGGATSIVGGGTSPYTYAWSNSQTTDNITGLSIGTYTLNVIDSNGCSATSSTNITQPLLLKDSIQKAAICLGDSATLSDVSSGGILPYSYLWNTGGTSTSITVSPIVSTKYLLVVTDSNGCVTKDSSYVKVNQPPIVTLTAQSRDTVCYGAGAILLFGNPNGGSYTGYAVHGKFFYPDSAIIGVYNVFYYSYTDSNGCSAVSADSLYVHYCTGINELKNGNETIIVFPNPNNGVFTIQSSFLGSKLSVEIDDVLGQKVYSQSNIQQSLFSIDLSTQAAGIYFYRVLKENSGILGEGKIIIQR